MLHRLCTLQPLIEPMSPMPQTLSRSMVAFGYLYALHEAAIGSLMHEEAVASTMSAATAAAWDRDRGDAYVEADARVVALLDRFKSATVSLFDTRSVRWLRDFRIA